MVLRSNSGTLSTAAARSSVANANNTTTFVFPALTGCKTDGTSMGLRFSNRGTNAALINTPPSGWTFLVANAVPGVQAAHNRPGLTANPTADTVTLTGASNSAYRCVTVEIQETPFVPLNETVYDDFNRADGLIFAGAGATKWVQHRVDYAAQTKARVIGNQLGVLSDGAADYSQAVSASKLDPGNWDLLMDCVATGAAPNEIAIWFNLKDIAGSGQLDGYTFVGSSVSDSWQLRKWTNGSWAALTSVVTAGGPIVVGDTIWIAKRGSTYIVYRKRSGGSFAKCVDATDSTFASSFFAIEMSDTSIRWDNVRGGPLVAPVFPLDETLIDNFNRADGPINAGAGAAIWRTDRMEGGNAQRVISNQHALSAEGIVGSGSEDACVSKLRLARDFDLLIDCVTYDGQAPISFFFCVENWGHYTTIDGSEVYCFDDVWNIRDNIVGGTTQQLSQNPNGPYWIPGCTVWIAKRGPNITVYHRSSGGIFVEVVKTTGATRWDRPGFFGFKAGDYSYQNSRFDNLRGGPIYIPPRSVVVI